MQEEEKKTAAESTEVNGRPSSGPTNLPSVDIPDLVQILDDDSDGVPENPDSS